MTRQTLLGLALVACGASVTPRAQQPRTASDLTSLTGRAMTGTGPAAQPVRRARVTLSGGGPRATRVTDTDTNGMYRFDRVPDGAHRITVQKPGFVKLDVDALPNATLQMVRGGAIEGVVTDSAGNPLWNLAVAAVQRQPGKETPAVIAQTRTDDRGRYRLHSLAEGDYEVEASTDRTFVQRLSFLSGEKPPEAGRTYYPAALTLDAAKPVHVSAGLESSAIDIAFALPSAPSKDPSAAPGPRRPDATGTARIAGTIVDAGSGKPIKGAQLLLLPIEGERITNWMRTDAQGRFEYASLQARRYTLRVEADRFVTLEFGQTRPGETGTPIQVREGEDFRADVKLPRSSALEGTLLDEFGDPAPNVLVQVAQRRYVAGRHRLLPTPSRLPPLVTDDRGAYRVSALAPGEYFVVALSGVYTEQDESGGFAPTYYPGTSSASTAVPVTVSWGADTIGTTFALAPAKTVTISGTMVDGEGNPVGPGTLWLATPDRLQQMDFNVARTSTTPDGHFVLRNVPQGMYTMQGFGPPPAGYRGPMNLGAMRFGWLPIATGDDDLEGVELRVTDGNSLRGRIVLEDTAASPPKPDQVHVTALPAEFDSAPVAGGPPPSETHDDWTFEVKNLSGMRRILVTVSSPGWQLKEVRLNGLDITDAPVDFRTKSVERADVVLTAQVTRIRGAVSDGKSAVADYAVVVFPSNPALWFDRSRFVAVARPTQDGRFDVGGLPPEEYWAIALPNIAGGEFADPEFLDQLRPSATLFTLAPGSERTLDLKLKKRP